MHVFGGDSFIKKRKIQNDYSMDKITRFRAYQLGVKGASFSLAVDDDFTLIEARLNDCNRANIFNEMRIAGAKSLSLLHITSWDVDHCNPDELYDILHDLKPQRIQYPGYRPDSDSGKKSLKMISDYLSQKQICGIEISPKYVNALEAGESARFSTILYNPTVEYEKHNDMSIVALFRKGRFTVLSLGDCESPEIANTIMNCSIANSETDVMLMAHHGADNGFTTEEFIKKIAPKIAICACDYDNQYDHPRKEVREILHNNDVRFFTTKTGDVLIVCDVNNNVHVTNYIGNGTKVSSTFDFRPKFTIK